MKATDYKKAEKIIKEAGQLKPKSRKKAALMTGFKGLDDFIGGFKKGELICIAGRPSMGKTGFALSIIKNICIDGGKGCLYFSLEDDSLSLIKRLNAIVSDNAYCTYSENDMERPEIKKSLKSIGKAPLYINDGAYSIHDIEKTSRKLAGKAKIDIIIVDYLQLISAKGKGKKKSEDYLSDVISSLKMLARKLECPIAVLCGLSRKIEKRKDHMPMLSDLKDSGRLDYYADKALFLYRDDYYNIDTERKGEADVIVAKNSAGGPVGIVLLAHKGGGLFEDMIKKHSGKKNI